MGRSMSEMLKNNYQTDDDYVLDALEEKEDELWGKLYPAIPEGELLNTFKYWLSIKSKMHDIEVEQAYGNGYSKGFNKGIKENEIRRTYD